MGTIRSHRDLEAWQLAHALGLSVYRLTGKFPADERFGLVSQMRRCAVSIASNIAEGYGRGSRVDYVRFLKIARGSLFELDSQCQLAIDLGFLPREAASTLAGQWTRTSQVLAALIRSLVPRTAEE
jgi:four helix bundle protein